uniref:Uncharacterized protein n=1 Tax=Cannabis sativa TaxID=3483 RepID=A0A803R0J7_CANSA
MYNFLINCFVIINTGLRRVFLLYRHLRLSFFVIIYLLIYSILCSYRIRIRLLASYCIIPYISYFYIILY